LHQQKSYKDVLSQTNIKSTYSKLKYPLNHGRELQLLKWNHRVMNSWNNPLQHQSISMLWN